MRELGVEGGKGGAEEWEYVQQLNKTQNASTD